MATLKFLESGTDATQDLSFFGASVTVNGTIASDATQSQDGPRSIKSDVTISGGSAYAYTPASTVSDAGALISGWFRFSTIGPATATKFISIDQSNDGSSIIGVGMTTGGKLRVAGRASTAKDGATQLVANKWYRISVGYIITTSTNWSATVYLDGVSEVTTSNADGTLSAVTTGGVAFGINPSSLDTWATPAVMTIWVDSIFIDNRTDKSDCGNVHVTAKRPLTNGTANGFVTQIGAGGSGYGTGHAPQVNERPLSATNGWSVVAIGVTTEEYNIETIFNGDVNVAGSQIVDYMGWLYYKTVLSETASIMLNGSSTAFTSTVNANTMFTKASGSTTYPVSTGTDIGMISDATATTVSLFEAGIVFAYKPTGGALPSLGVGT